MATHYGILAWRIPWTEETEETLSLALGAALRGMGRVSHQSKGIGREEGTGGSSGSRAGLGGGGRVLGKKGLASSQASAKSCHLPGGALLCNLLCT